MMIKMIKMTIMIIIMMMIMMIIMIIMLMIMMMIMLMIMMIMCHVSYLAVGAHHGRVVSGVGGGLLAGGGDHLLAVLGHGGVHDLIVLSVALLPGVLHLPGVAGLHRD